MRKFNVRFKTILKNKQYIHTVEYKVAEKTAF